MLLKVGLEEVNDQIKELGVKIARLGAERRAHWDLWTEGQTAAFRSPSFGGDHDESPDRDGSDGQCSKLGAGDAASDRGYLSASGGRER